MPIENPDQGRISEFAPNTDTHHPLEGIHALTLDEVKLENQRRSEMAGNVQILGTFKDIDPNGTWLGKTSVKERIASGELIHAEVMEALASVEKFYIPTTDGAQERCVDERPAEGYESNSAEMYSEPLGPQGVAGSVGDAIAYRLALPGDVATYQSSDADILGDTVQVTKHVPNRRFIPGDHVDQGNIPGKTGCGGIDGCEDHMAYIPDGINSIQQLQVALMGDQFDLNSFDHIVANSQRVLGIRDQYFEEKDGIIKLIREANPNGAPVLEGQHHGIGLSINFVKDSTLHRDEFSASTGHKMGIFNYDAWYTVEMAKEYFPDDEEAQNRYVHGRIAMAISTAKHLMDDSLYLIIRKPEETAVLA